MSVLFLLESKCCLLFRIVQIGFHSISKIVLNGNRNCVELFTHWTWNKHRPFLSFRLSFSVYIFRESISKQQRYILFYFEQHYIHFISSFDIFNWSTTKSSFRTVGSYFQEMKSVLGFPANCSWISVDIPNVLLVVLGKI